MSLPLLLTLPALVLLQAQTTFYAAWEDGQDAERRSRFEAALAAYERATELHPRSSAQVVIYGNNLLRGYFPYTRIARCCLELARWDAAEKALARAEREGEPQEELRALAERLAKARPKAAPEAPAMPPPAPSTKSAPVASPAPVLPAPAPSQAPATTPERPRPLDAMAQGTEKPEPPPKAQPPAPVAPVLPAVLPQATPSPEAHGAPVPARNRGWLPFLGMGAVALAGVALAAFGRRKRPALDHSFRHPEQVGPYRIERLLGRGGFASTYLARKANEKAPVALKLLHPFRQDDPEFLGRFRQEARLGSLLDHPNIVRLLDQGPQGDTPWLVMEYVEGQRLDAFLKEQGPLPLPLLVDLGSQIASAMAHAHARSVIHRDLKPGNILLVDGQIKVMDFGIARIMDSATLTTTYAFLGTPSYAAPELQLKTQVGPPADQYSFGILLFELAAGRTPFQGETPFEILDKHRREELPNLAALRPDAPAALVDLVNRLARKDPATRPGDDEILAVLESLAARGRLDN